jgi:hypothetical protein
VAEEGFVNAAHDVETQVAAIAAYLRAELGYDGDTPGHMRRQVEENTAMIRTIDRTLRGEGDEPGLVGWMMVLRRSWVTMVAILGAALGYVMNDLMDAIRPEASAHVVSQRTSDH